MFQPVRSGVLLALLVTSVAQADEPPRPPPRPVRVQTVAFAPRTSAVVYSGAVQARVQAAVGFRVAGKVIERDINIGDHVTAGQVLARLDPADARLNLEVAVQAERAASAEAANARAEFARYQRLGRTSPAYLPTEFDKRQATLAGDEARLAQALKQVVLAEDQLDYTVLRADADGVITDLKMETGQVVSAGQTVASLAHAAETEIVVDVPENRLAEVRAAEDVTISLWSHPDVVLHGRTREIGALADNVSRTFAVKVTVLDAPATDLLALGMTASVRFEHVAGPPVALLPASAIVSAGGTPSVWVLDPAAHRAVTHPVRIAAWYGDGQAAVSDGIAEGMQVVTAGASQLDASMPVTAWAGAIR